MANVKLSKFPVTAPDGTEYRVTIEEFVSAFYYETVAEVTLYTRRKRFGFRRIFRETYVSGGGVYNSKAPDYVSVSSAAVHDYYAAIESRAQLDRQIAEERHKKKAALEQFAEWDGRIAE